jgi:hypothetical protein
MHISSTIYIFNEPGQEQNQIKCVMGSAKNLIPTMKKQTHKPKAGKSPPGFCVARLHLGLKCQTAVRLWREREIRRWKERDPAMNRERSSYGERERSLGRRWAAALQAALAVGGGRRILAERDFENFGEKKWEK